MSVLFLASGKHCEAPFVYAEIDRWKRIKRELEVVANTLRNSPHAMVDDEGSDLLDLIKAQVTDCVNDVTGRIKSLEGAE